MIDIYKQFDFKFSFFANFYKKNLEKEYIKVREDYKLNDFVYIYIHSFRLLSGVQVEDVAGLIREVQVYREESPSIADKIKVEKLLKGNLTAVDPNCAFKKDNLTGYLCHIIRDIIFYSGCICNMSYVMPECFNTVSHYKYLIEKKAHLNAIRFGLGSYLCE
jgi:hypothetical protein